MCVCVHGSHYTQMEMNENPRFMGGSPQTPGIFENQRGAGVVAVRCGAKSAEWNEV